MQEPHETVMRPVENTVEDHASKVQGFKIQIKLSFMAASLVGRKNNKRDRRTDLRKFGELLKDGSRV